LTRQVWMMIYISNSCKHNWSWKNPWIVKINIGGRRLGIKTLFCWDHNTSYFQRVVKIKYSSKRILSLLNGAYRINTLGEIEPHVLSYFPNIFGAENICIMNIMVSQSIPLLVTKAENLRLTSVFGQLLLLIFNLKWLQRF